jgi:UDP-N-acetyl-alpha-D-quinovosamine dehydrogenase
MARILVTGASGFIGEALVAALTRAGEIVRAGSRTRRAAADNVGAVCVGMAGPGADWADALKDADAVVHLAGPAHAKHDPAYLHTAIAEGTAALAQQAAQAGVRRFVFVSSIKATAAHTHGRPVSERDAPAPGDAYGRAKHAAEQAVLATPELNPVVLRPPLVFAANAKGNFAQLLRLADTSLPLPFAGVENRRSLISLNSCVEAIMVTLHTPGPSGVFHIADEPALSTPDIVDALRRGLGRPARQFRAPGLSMLSPPALTGSLEIDASAFRAAFPWRGEADVAAALTACAAAWKARR